MTTVYKITNSVLNLILLCVFISCTNKKEVNNSNAEVIKCLNCSRELTFPESDNLFEKVEYIQLETSKSYLIKQFDYIEVFDTLIFIVDDNHLYKFNKNTGGFISEIGSRGQGAAEYIGIKSFFIDSLENTITVFDLSQSKTIKYDFEGNYISSHRIGINTNLTNTALYMKTGNVLFHNLLSPYSKFAYSISTGTAKAPKNLISYGIFKLKEYSLAFSEHPMTYSEDGIDCLMPFDNTVYQVKNDSDAVFSAKYSVEFSGKPADLSMATQEEPPIFVTRQLMAMDNCFPGFTAIFEMSGKLVLNSYNNKALPCFFYANIKNKEGSYYNYAVSPAGKNPIFTICGVSANTFIAKIDAFTVSTWREQLKNFEMVENAHLKSLLENMREDDNPIIALYYIQL